MIVLLSPDVPPVVTDLDRLDRLHAERTGAVGSAQMGDLCRPGPDDEHVWLSVEGLREAGSTQSGDDGFVAKFDGMISYASSQGWLNDDGTHVRAHIETSS